MTSQVAKRAPVVRLPPKSNVELLLLRGAQVAVIVMGTIAAIFALHAGEYILAPAGLGVVIGLMLGPVATRLESSGLRPGLSASLVVLLFIAAICLFALAIAGPLSFWLSRVPQLWSDLQLQLSELKAPLETLKSVRDQLREVTGSNGVTVSLDQGSEVESVALLAPALAAQILIFFACLYFFVATRNQTRVAVLKLCLDRRLRWRVAHIFRDVEKLVSRYLLSITVINVAEGIAVGLAMQLIGLPSAVLWGVLAALANFIVFVGPAFMVAILLLVGIAEFDTMAGSLLPVVAYLVINTIEGQFVTPLVIGRAMTLNPFLVVLALIFWIWLWGPLGGFIAIPALLVVYAVIRNIVPGINWADDVEPRRH
ncbi:AI-2E family transporter [Mesorhizobium sp. ZMM04-5]|uniref:AI-2E family transporter n=1 Tax=Mesorhizobium marinum TaxID=3228790 RepID=A0ABV3QY40_9HYPH